MCGILAISINGTEKDLQKIVKAHESLSKRGPDRGCMYIEETRIYAFRRLSIVNTSTEADQPFHIGDVAMLCNGEIYNHKLLEDTYNLSCDTKSDCECIIQLYNKIGFCDMVRCLDGDFAIIILEGDNIYIARDRIGVRPLFYGTTFSGNFAVGSTAESLCDYCTDVKQLLPCMAIYNRIDKSFVKIHYTNNIENIYTYMDTRYIIRKLLTESIQKRLMSDRPIGCMLSGGLDSSLVASIMCKLIGPKNVRTYSIGIKGSKDLEYAKIVSDYLGTIHTEVLFTPQEGFDAIPNVIKDIESYDVTTVRASVGMWLLAKYISKNTDDIVIMSGEGADEIFGGYLYFHHAPTPEQFETETSQLVSRLYEYDVLRADRCISSHGLEPRVPFLDRTFLDYVLKIPGELRKPIDGYEKYILRASFEEGDYLPLDVLWRRKDGFSDGVSGSDGKKWYEEIQHYIGESGVENEEKYYRKILDKHFPTFQPKIDRWLPKWVEHNGDPSGRNIVF